MAYEETIGNDNTYEKREMFGIIDEIFVNPAKDPEKPGNESLEIKVKVEDGGERTAFMKLGTKHWEKQGGKWVPAFYAEATSFINAALAAGCKLRTDIETKKEEVKGVKYEIYDLEFTPSLVGAKIDIKVRDSIQKDDDGKDKTYKNYYVEKIELVGGNPAVETKPAPATPAGRSKPEPKQSELPDSGRATSGRVNKNDEMKMQYDAGVAFKNYLVFLTEEKDYAKIRRENFTRHLDEFQFENGAIRDWIAGHMDKLISDCLGMGRLVQDGDKFRFIPDQE